MTKQNTPWRNSKSNSTF